jgi:hypothetical protein
MVLVLLILCMPIVECVCPHCFDALPSCSWETNSKCPSDTTITENIALVAAVSSATAIAGGKLFKMPAVMAQKYLRMFTSAGLAALLRLCLKSTAGTAFELTASTTVAEAMQAIRNGQITAADVIVGFGGFIDGAADVAAERKLAAKAKTIAEARDAGLLAVGLSTDADQCGPWLFLWAKVTNFVMNRTTALSSVVVETGEGKPPSTVTVRRRRAGVSKMKRTSARRMSKMKRTLRARSVPASRSRSCWRARRRTGRATRGDRRAGPSRCQW